MVAPNVLRGAALVQLGAADEGAARIREGVAEWRRKGATFSLPFALASLADALAKCGEHAAALAAAREGLEVASGTGERVWDAELHRLSGVALLADNKIDQSQACFEQALLVARHQQAKSYELRAATNLASLWAQQGRRMEARELLTPVHGWFTEGFNTADLKETARFLFELD
jgi:adenylate cyclase